MSCRNSGDWPFELGDATIRASGPDGPKLVRSGGKRWSDTAERTFLDALGASCNVDYAADAAGFRKCTLYRRRREDPAFAERWLIALTQGYHRLEEQLLQRATEAMGGYVPDPEAPMPPVGFRDAMALLAQHRATVAGAPIQGRAKRARVRPIEEVRESILAKLEAIEAKRLREDAAARAAAAAVEDTGTAPDGAA